MTFKLDELSPVARFNALQRAKEWQERSSGNSPTNFSSDLVARSGPGRAVQDYDLSPQEIILPEDGVFSTAGGNISDSQFDAYRNASELARRALGLKGAVHRSNMQLEYLEELAADAARDKERSIWSSIGGTAGSLVGNMILPGIGGPIGDKIGRTIGGQIS